MLAVEQSQVTSTKLLHFLKDTVEASLTKQCSLPATQVRHIFTGKCHEFLFFFKVDCLEMLAKEGTWNFQKYRSDLSIPQILDILQQELVNMEQSAEMKFTSLFSSTKDTIGESFGNIIKGLSVPQLSSLQCQIADSGLLELQSECFQPMLIATSQ